MSRLHLLRLSLSPSGHAPIELPRDIHPLARARPQTSLQLKVIQAGRANARQPAAGATVVVRDAKAFAVGGITDSNGRVRLRTGRAVVPIGNFRVYVEHAGQIFEGAIDAPGLVSMRVDPAIHCNTIIELVVA